MSACIAPAPAALMFGLLERPTYFATLIGVWKVLGALAIAVPGLPRLEEWAPLLRESRYRETVLGRVLCLCALTRRLPCSPLSRVTRRG